MLATILALLIWVCLAVYLVLGGADYGAGILECFNTRELRDQQEELVAEAMGPVWEANHIWLILIVVALFVGFPGVFQILVTSLHIPLLMILLGVMLRGTAFTFRHYDPIASPGFRRIYSWCFAISSVWTSIWLGILGASLHRGHINLTAADFHTVYVAPWWGFYPLSVGVFLACLFAFLASVFLTGESDSPALQHTYQKKAQVSLLLAVVTGGFVFASSWWEGNGFAVQFLQHSFSLTCLIFATLSLPGLWWLTQQHKTFAMRLLAVLQVLSILGGWLAVCGVAFLVTSEGPVTPWDAAAPDSTLKQLLLALAVGSFLIVPSLAFLFWVFKKKMFR
jgi:cytochrome d ubiquinol oxidase subunit II